MAAIMDGEATPAQIAGLLVALRHEGRAAGRDRRLRAHHARTRPCRCATPRPDVFDTCGTGGDGAGTFNISTVVGARRRRLRRAGRQARQPLGLEPLRQRRRVRGARRQRRGAARRSSSAASPRPGSASSSRRPTIPSMRHAAALRRELGVRTAFNLLGPLTNPAGARRQLVGVPRPELTELVARALGCSDRERAWVVHGADGLDEISTTGYTKVSEARRRSVRTFYVHPADVGLAKATLADLAGGDAAENAAIIAADPRRRAGPGARHRAAERRRGAARGRTGDLARRRHRPRRTSRRSRGAARRRCCS